MNLNSTKEIDKKKRYNEFYMDLAERVSKMSHARRLQVGTVLVKNDNIISFGWNGMPAGWDNNCENEVIDSYSGSEGVIHRTKLVTKPEVLHAEQNALAKLARSTESGVDATIYITHAPCIDCAKLIFQSGIRKVFHRHSYRNDDGIKFLEKCEINHDKI